MSTRTVSPSTAGLVPDHAAGAWQALSHALSGSPAPIPCDGRDEWVSARLTDRHRAVMGCLECPVLDLCARYADQAGERAGVWGAIDRERPTKYEPAR